MAPNPPSSSSAKKHSIETEPVAVPKKPKKPEKDVETTAETAKAKRIETGTGSTRSRAEISLESLKSRAETSDHTTAELIDGLNLNESPEKQKKNMDALLDTSVTLFSAAFYQNAITADEIARLENINRAVYKFTNITEGQRAYNAALRKLIELASKPDNPNAIFVKNEWTRLVQTAKKTSGRVDEVKKAPQEISKPKDKWSVTGFIKEYPKTSAAIAVAGAVAGFFAIRGLYRWITKTEARIAVAPKATQVPEGPWRWLKWVLPSALAVFVFGRIAKFEKVAQWAEKLGVSVKEAWAKLTGENPELAKHNELYTRMAKRIGTEMSSPIEADLLANIGAESYKNFIEDDGWWKRNIEDPAKNLATDNPVAKFFGIQTPAQRKQANIIRNYLKETSRQKIIATMAITNETTLGQVIAHIDAELNRKEGMPVAEQKPEGEKKAGEIAAALAPEQIERYMLEFLKTNYGEMSPENYRKIASLPYREFIAMHKSGLLAETVERGKQAAQELGAIEAAASEDSNFIYAQNILRRFLKDNQALILTLSIPADATIGYVLAEMVKSNKPLKTQEVLIASQGAEISDDEIEGTSKRDIEAKKLPSEKFAVYIKHRKMLREMLDKNEYLTNEEIDKMIEAASGLANTIKSKALETIPEKAKREKRIQLADAILLLAEQLKIAKQTRSNALSAYTQAIASNASEEELHAAFLQMTNDANRHLSSIYNSLEHVFVEERDMLTVGGLVGLKATRIIRVHLKTSDQTKAFARHYYGSFLLPTEVIRRINSRLRQPKHGLALAEYRVKQGKLRIEGELGGANALGEGSLEKRRPPHGRKPEGKEETLAYRRYEAENKLFVHDKHILKRERWISQLERTIEACKKDPTKIDFVKRCEGLVAKNRAAQKLLLRERLKLEEAAIAEAADDFYGRVKTHAPTEKLKPHEWRELDDLAGRGAQHNRAIVREGDRLIGEIKQALKAGDIKKAKGLERIFNETMGGITLNTRSIFGTVKETISSLRGNEPGTELSSSDAKQFRQVIGKILNWQGHPAKAVAATATESITKNMLRVAGGKLAFYGVTIGIGGLATMDQKTDFTTAVKQAAWDIAPLTGTWSDFSTAVTGREKFTGRKVEGYERFILRPVFGVLGFGADVLILADGLGLAARAGLNVLKGGVQAGKLARIAAKGRKATKAIEAAEAATKTAKTAKTAEVAGETATTAAIPAIAERSTILAALARVRKHGTAVTLGLGLGAVALNIVKQDEIDVPPEIKQIAGPNFENIEIPETPEMPEETS